MTPDFDWHEFLQALVTGGIPRGPIDGSQTLDLELLRQNLPQDYELLDIREKSAHARLCALGLSPEFLALLGEGNNRWVEFFKAWASEKLGAAPPTRQTSPRVLDARLLLRNECKYTLSPWSGIISPTRDSIGPGWFLFRDEKHGFIVGQMSTPAVRAHDTVWILPTIKKILFIDMGLGIKEIVNNISILIAKLARRSDKLIAHLKTDVREIVIYDWQCDHFGHYVWNVLSAWGSLFEFIPPETIKGIACTNPQNFFGEINDIFELDNNEINKYNIKNIDHVYDVIFSDLLLISSINAHFISRKTADAVTSHSLEKCEKTFSRRLSAHLWQHWPVVLFSLRFENRAWVDQVAGLAELGGRLRQDFPQIGFVIHGLSKDVSMGWTTSWMSLDLEIQAAAELEAALGGAKDVINAVGGSIHESVAISKACDAFVAPVGSGMALYKWLTNKPGVAFSNRFCLDPANPGRGTFAIFDRCRDDIIPASYLPLSAVTDLEATRHGHPSRVNFLLDREILYEMTRDLLLALPSRPIGSR